MYKSLSLFLQFLDRARVSHRKALYCDVMQFNKSVYPHLCFQYLYLPWFNVVQDLLGGLKP